MSVVPNRHTGCSVTPGGELWEEVCAITPPSFLLHKDTTKHNYTNSAILNYICAADRQIPHTCTPLVYVCVRVCVIPLEACL